jgi:hypothetical protein
MNNFITSNWLLLIIAPVNLISGFYLVEFVGQDKIVNLITVLLVSTFEIGIVRESMVRQKRPSIRVLFMSLLKIVLIICCLFFVIIKMFKYNFTLEILLFFVLTLILNEIKSYFDGIRRYDLGLLLRTLSSVIIPYILLSNFIYLFILYPFALYGLWRIIVKVSNFTLDLSDNGYSRFAMINAFSIVSGNVEKMILSYYLMGPVWITSFLVFGELNRKIQSFYGFFSSLFLYGQLENIFKAFVGLFLSLCVVVFAIYLYLGSDINYLFYSCSTVLGIFSQYLIYIELRKSNQAKTSFFGIFGIAVLGLGMSIFVKLEILTFNNLIFLICLKSLVEVFYLYLIRKRMESLPRMISRLVLFLERRAFKA